MKPQRDRHILLDLWGRYGAGATLRFVPPYSPDFNPIRTLLRDT